ncbi:MAG: hypothetical protein WC496_00665 [Phycisphaerae bacterium]
MKKRPEEILYELQKTVTEEFFKENPLKKFPEDFLSNRVKKELKAHFTVSLPEVKLSKRITGASHRDRRKKIDLKDVMRHYYRVMAIEENSADKYFVVGLPGGKLKINAHRKFEICSEKGPSSHKGFAGTGPSSHKGFAGTGTSSHKGSAGTGDVLLEFDSLEQAKYLLYARRKEQCVYKLPKSKVVVKRAVEKYEKYIKEVKEELAKAFMRRGVKRELAEEFAKLVIEEKLTFKGTSNNSGN